MTFKQFAETLEYQPMETFPWVRDPEEPENTSYWEVPVGVVVREERPAGVSYELFGTEMAGRRTNGCDCCSSYYEGYLPHATGWTWVTPALAK
jgi:hypothetical protein